MRAVTVANGRVTGVVDLSGKVIDEDGRAARGMAHYIIESREGVSAVEYEAVQDAPPNSIFIESDVAEAGWTYKNGEMAPPPVDQDELALAKLSLCAAVNAQAETERLKYITPGAGQALTYFQKLREADACLAEDDLPADQLPFLTAEVGITAGTVRGVALAVKQAHQNWAQIGAVIEKTRLGAHLAINSKATTAEAEAVVSAIEWPSPQQAAG